MEEHAPLSWRCEDFNSVLRLVDDWLESSSREAPEPLVKPRLVEAAVAEQRRHLEECLCSLSSSVSGQISPEVATEIVSFLLGAFERLWQAYARSRERSVAQEEESDACCRPRTPPKALEAELQVQALTAEIHASEQRLEEAMASQAEATVRESEREMRLCRMMGQEAREAAELREALRLSERSADNRVSEEEEERNIASAQLRRCQTDLAKAQRRNTELLKDLQMLCAHSRAERSDEAQKSPATAPLEEFSLAKGLTSFFGGNQAARSPRADGVNAERSSLLGGFGSISSNENKQGGVGQSTGTGGGGTPRCSGGTTPRGSGKGGSTPRGMPGSMRELAQILAPQKLVKVDPASPEARAVQLQKLVRDLTADLQDRDSRITDLTRELRRHRSSVGGLEVLGEGDERGHHVPEASVTPLSPRGSRAEGGHQKPKIKRLSLPRRNLDDEDGYAEDLQKGGLRAAQSAR